MTMEDLVEHLAVLQDDLDAESNKARKDELMITLSDAVDVAAKQLDAAKVALSNAMIYYEATAERIESEIEETKTHIIDAWDGEKKTLKFDAGTLKFRTTQSAEINDGAALLANLIEHFSTNKIADEYIKGFNLTAVKKYMGVHELPIDVAEIEYKTNVNLDVI